jgi:hypothetical protein
MFWNNLVVRSNHAYDQMADSDVQAVLTDLSAALPK